MTTSMAPLLQVLLFVAVAGLEPNPPHWPPSVRVYDMETANLSAKVQELFEEMGPVHSGKFSSQRIALLFKPGTYDIDVPVGYYTQVLGLGRDPGDVEFRGRRGVNSPGQKDNNNFDTFWKMAENVANRPAQKQTIWSVSQAAPLRRMHIAGDLLLGEYSESAPNRVAKGSGGFFANVNVSGSVDFLLQQQWMVRNSQINGSSYHKHSPRAANFVFVGTHGAPPQSESCTDAASNPVDPRPQELAVDVAPVSIEKPYIMLGSGGRYELVTPKARLNSRGVDWNDAFVDDFERVFVASNSTSTSEINSKLDAGYHVVLSPGIYRLEVPIKVGWKRDMPYQVLLGLGLATLVPTRGNPAVLVGPAGGVRVAGLLLQAGKLRSRQLLQWTASAGDASNPGLLADVFARVGGPDTEVVSADVMLEVNGGHVVLDNVWAWRADCCQDGCGTCAIRYCDHGVVVNGDHVTSYGLFSEHCQKDLTVWNGENGQVFFYQSEMDSFAREQWDNTPDYGDNGVSGYRVNAQKHNAVGVGVYAFFTQPGNKVKAGTILRHRNTLNTVQCPFKWDLNPAWYNNSLSGIEHSLAYEFNTIFS